MRKRIVNTIDPKLITAGKKLRNIDYTVNQLADKLNLSPRYIRRALIQLRKAPHRKDKSGHILINGKEIYEWALSYREAERQRKEEKGPLGDDEFYCVKCRKRVIGKDIYLYNDGFNNFKKAICPCCGYRVNKYLKGNDNGKNKE